MTRSAAKPPRKESTPAIPLFGDAYLSDTHHLSLEEHGAYLKLLMIAWRTADCSLPDDDKRLAMMLGVSTKRWGQLKPVVMEFWRLSDGQWTQKRLTKERLYVQHKRAKNAEAANERWNGQTIENKGTAPSERISGRKSERISQEACINDAPPPPPLIPTDKSVGRAKHLIPDDWQPVEFGAGTDCRRIVEGWTGLEFERQIERFRAHHERDGNRYSNWQAAWKTWVLNSVEFNRGSRQREDHGRAPPRDIVASVLAEHQRGHGS